MEEMILREGSSSATRGAGSALLDLGPCTGKPLDNLTPIGAH